MLTPLHSERWSDLCDEGRPKSELVASFPFIREWEVSLARPHAFGLTDVRTLRVPSKQKVGKFLEMLRPLFYDLCGPQGFDELAENWTPTSSTDCNWRQIRLPMFTAWLKAQAEDRIAVVGHGAFFQPLLGRHLRNCEVAEINLD